MAAPQVQHGQGSARRSSLMLMMQRHKTSVLAGAAGLGTQQAVGVRRLATTQDWCALAVTVALRPWAFVLNFFGYMVGGLVLLRIWSRSGLYMIVLIWYVFPIWYRSNS